MTLHLRVVAGISAALLLLAAACGGDDDDDSDSAAAGVEETTTTTGDEPATATDELDIELPADILGTPAGDLIASANASEDYELALFAPNLADPGIQRLVGRAEDYAELIGIDVEVFDAGGYGEGANQASQIDDAAQRGFDGLVIFAADPAAIAPSVSRAVEAGTPAVSFVVPDVSGAVLSQVQNDIRQVGALQCEAMAESERAKSGPLSVVMLSGPGGNAAMTERANGFRECAEAAGWTILDEHIGPSARDDGLNATEDFIQRFGDDIDGVYSAVGFLGHGAVDALERAGKTLGEDGVMVTTAVSDDELFERVRDGKIYAAVDQRASGLAIAAVAAMVHALNGGDVPETVVMPMQVVTTATAGDYEANRDNVCCS